MYTNIMSFMLMYGHMYFQMTMRTLGLSIQDMVIYKMRRRSVDGLMQKLKFMMALGNGLFAGAECLENTLLTYTVEQEIELKSVFYCHEYYCDLCDFSPF